MTNIKRNATPNKAMTAPYGCTSNAKPEQRTGWTYKARQQYVAGRFNGLEATNTVPPSNHKVEQVMRGMCFGLSIQNTATNTTHLQNDDPFAVVQIGYQLPCGKLRPSPDSVTRLAMMGYSAQLLLENISRISMVADDGTKHPVIAPDEDGQLYCALEFLRVESWHLVFGGQYQWFNLEGAK